MKAVVLAAGEGVRMRPLTSGRSKHMIKLAGKPILEYVLLSLRASGIKEAAVVVGYKKELIKQFFGDGSKLGMKLEYIIQSGVSGTADALGLTEKYVGDENFVAVYGDLLIKPEAIRPLFSAHKKGAAATIGVVPVKQPEQYGAVEVKNGKIINIIEKPKAGKAKTNLANAAIFIFTSKIFEKIKRTKYSPRKELEITDSIRYLIEDKMPVVAAKINPDNWMDIGRPWDLLEANKRVLQDMKLEVRGEIEDGVHITGPVGLCEGARLRSGTYIEGPVFIDEDSDIGPNCYIRPYTSIGKNVRIGNACEIKNSIIMDRTHVAHLSYIADSVVGENCNFGAGVITANLRFDDKPVKVKVKDELIDSGLRKLGVFMGDDVKVGVNANFMPGVKIGSNSCVGPSMVVYQDVEPNVLILKKQELTEKRRKN